MKRLACLLLALAGCTDDDPGPSGDPVVSHVARGEYRMQYGATKDVLFVVDNSPASAALQPAFRTLERAMLEQMTTFDYGKLPNVHVGVVTTDPADQGRLRQGRYLADELQFDEQRHRNYDGAFIDTALELLDVGTSGTAAIRPLAAVQMALSPTVNPGFRRPDWDLVVVVLAAGDDTDPRPLDEVRAALGPAMLSIVTPCGASTPRLDALAPGHATACDADPAAVIAAAGAFWQTLEGRCLPGLLSDVDPTTPGEQHDCAAWMLDPLTGDTRAFPECSAEHPDGCWAPAAGTRGGCDEGYGLELRPTRLQYPAQAMIECVVAPAP